MLLNVFTKNSYISLLNHNRLYWLLFTSVQRFCMILNRRKIYRVQIYTPDCAIIHRTEINYTILHISN